MTFVLAAEDTLNMKAKDAALKTPFSQTLPISEVNLPLIMVYMNNYEVSAWFSSLHFLANGKLQGFATSRGFSLL